MFISVTYFKKAVILRCFLMASICIKGAPTNLFFSFLESLKSEKCKRRESLDLHGDFYHVSPYTEMVPKRRPPRAHTRTISDVMGIRNWWSRILSPTKENESTAFCRKAELPSPKLRDLKIHGWKMSPFLLGQTASFQV